VAKRPQLSVVLGSYHDFVVARMAERMDRSVSQVIATMVEQWVTDHQTVVADIEATVRNFRDWQAHQDEVAD